jgi:excisionase family DNA binding protein
LVYLCLSIKNERAKGSAPPDPILLIFKIIKMNKQFDCKKQLNRIEAGTIAKKNVLTFEEGCILTDISKSYMYKLTSGKKVPHFKPFGGRVYFNRLELEKWLLKNPISADTEKESQNTSNRKEAV